MLDVLQGFVHELRLAGLPVSMTENLDAMRAVEHVPLEDRDAFKTALGATLVKHHGHHKVFDTVFEVYFSIFSPGVDGGEARARRRRAGRLRPAPQRDGRRRRDGPALQRRARADAPRRADAAWTPSSCARSRRAAVARFAGMEPGRPVGGAYYLYRTLRQLDAEGLVGKMMEQAQQDDQRSARARSTSGSRAKSTKAGSRS